MTSTVDSPLRPLATVSAGLPTRVDPWRPVRWALLAIVVVASVTWLRHNGVLVDRLWILAVVALLLAVASVGRPWRHWVRLGCDLTLYAAIWLAYEESRAIADGLGSPLQVESVRNIDRLLFFGNDPSVWLQEHFYSPDTVQWFDVVASILYATHYPVPAAIVIALWIRNRKQWVRFMRRLATVLFIGCVGFVVLPTAPPWMAAGGDPTIRLDALPPLERPVGRFWQHIGLDVLTDAWDTGRNWLNNVAAMPSLHAAFSLLVVVFFLPWVRQRALRIVLLAFPVGVAVSVVYLAEHYVTDVLAGWATVGVAFIVWNRLERRAARVVPDDAGATMSRQPILEGSIT